MIRFKTIGLAACVLATTAVADPAPKPAAGSPEDPRALGPSLALAVKAAQAAIATCLANGHRTTAVVVDAAGVPVALLAGDGVPARIHDVAMRKAAAALRYGIPSGEVLERVQTDPALAAEVAADPKIGRAMRGAIPLFSRGKLIGAVAVSGAPGRGENDEPCAAAAVRAIQDRLG